MGFVLDTAELPARDRIDAVFAAMMAASASCYVTHEDPHGTIRSRMELWDLGSATIFSMRSTGIRLLRTAKQASDELAPIIALSLQQLSDGRHHQLTRRRVVRPGELMLMDLSAPYDFSWSGLGGAGCLQLPIDQLGLPVDLIRRAAGCLDSSTLYPLVTAHIAHLVGDAERLSQDPAAPALGNASVELVRALLASAAHSDRYARDALSESLLTRIRAYVRQHLTDPELRPATIAAAHNISVRYLYKICARAEFGLEQWIIGERLERAREELIRPESRWRPIAVIARRCGFTDPTHFSRRFRAAYGVTPREWRRTGTAVDDPSSRGERDDPGADAANLRRG
jgi:AraC-like DNA-binding protein